MVNTCVDGRLCALTSRSLLRIYVLPLPSERKNAHLSLAPSLLLVDALCTLVAVVLLGNERHPHPRPHPLHKPLVSVSREHHSLHLEHLLLHSANHHRRRFQTSTWHIHSRLLYTNGVCLDTTTKPRPSQTPVWKDSCYWRWSHGGLFCRVSKMLSRFEQEKIPKFIHSHCIAHNFDVVLFDSQYSNMS